MALLTSLREFTLGKLTREQLLAEFDGSLSDDLSDTAQLRAALDEVSRWEQFPGDITDVLQTRLVQLDPAGSSQLSSASGSNEANASSLEFGAYQGSDPFVYASFAEADAAAVSAELSWLTGRSLRMAFEELPFPEAAAEAAPSEFANRRIAECSLLLYFLSPASASDQRARRELAQAVDQGKPTIIVHLAPTELPLGLSVSIAALPAVSCQDQVPEEYRPKIMELIESRFGSQVATGSNRPAAVDLQPRTVASPKAGDLLDERFELLEQIGEGGMSIVFKAIDRDTYGQPQVAVKVLNPSFGRHPDALITLQREAAKSRALAHPNVVNVHDFVDSKHKYMWMEYLPGRSLAERLREGTGRMGQQEATVIIEGIVRALTYAHANKIVHADFKPANVMLTQEPVTDPDQVKVIDLGIAQAIRHPDDVNDNQTIFDIRSLHAFTIGYASPQLIDNAAAEPGDDIYALACIAYEMLTGRHPFNRESSKRAQQKGMLVERRPELSSRQFNAIRHGLRFERESRTESAQEFLQEFSGGSLRSSALNWGPPRPAVLAAAAVVGIVLVLTTQMDWISGWFTPGTPEPGERFRDCSQCPELIVLPAGAFEQGSNPAAGVLRSETPRRTVQIPGILAAAVHEVTVAEFRPFALATNLQTSGCMLYRQSQWRFDPEASWANPGFEQTPEHPVACVSWIEAQDYAVWLSESTGETYRLPSASEWEYLARAGSPDIKEQDLCAHANVADQHARTTFAGWRVHDCNDGTVFTAAVGGFNANDFGVRDILGNVFEWSADCWNPNYRGAPVDGSAWKTGDCARRELRGASWHTQPPYASVSFRNSMNAGERSSSIGFRVVREITTADGQL